VTANSAPSSSPDEISSTPPQRLARVHPLKSLGLAPVCSITQTCARLNSFDSHIALGYQMCWSVASFCHCAAPRELHLGNEKGNSQMIGSLQWVNWRAFNANSFTRRFATEETRVARGTCKAARYASVVIGGALAVASLLWSQPALAADLARDLSKILLTCPRLDGTDAVDQKIWSDVKIAYGTTAASATQIDPPYCSQPMPEMPDSAYSDGLIILQSLRAIYYMDLGPALPWTGGRNLYDWMKAMGTGVWIQPGRTESEACLGPANKYWICMPPTSATDKPLRRSLKGLLQRVALLAHERRHIVDGGSRKTFGHYTGCTLCTGPCDYSYNESNLSPYGVQMWLESRWLSGEIFTGLSCLDTREKSLAANTYLAAQVNDLATTKFCTRTPTPPQVTVPATPGGVCPITFRQQPLDYAGSATSPSNGIADPVTWTPSNGNWHFNGSNLFGWGQPGDIPVPGYWDTFAGADVAIWRPVEWYPPWQMDRPGVWHIRNSFGFDEVLQLGTSEDVPVPAAYSSNPNHYTNTAVWSPYTGIWTIPAVGNFGPFGRPGDIPVPADYDGDGRADIALYRPSTGQWSIIESSTGSRRPDVTWGVPTDIPVPADFDGDNRTDIAVWRPGNAYFIIINSSNGVAWSFPFGESARGDVPVPGHYNNGIGDDAAVWRSSTGEWIISQDTIGIYTPRVINVGSLGDVAVP
jgi:hypothetical protein